MRKFLWWVRYWWLGPCGGLEVLRVAWPLMVSMGSGAVMHFCDRIFLSWYAPQAMAAALPAGVLHFTLLCLPFGIAIYVNPFVAQYEGAGRFDRIGRVVWQGVWIGLVTGPLFLVTIPLAPYWFTAMGHSAELARLETLYYQILTYGASASICGGAMSAFFTGRRKTRVVMWVDSSAAALNVLLDYAWIFGHWGFPAWGIEGAAWATVVSQWYRVVVYLGLIFQPGIREKYGIVSGLRVDVQLLRRLLYYGTPNGLQLLAEVAAFTLMLLLIGRLGDEAMAATTAAFNVNSFAFVPTLGLGIGLTAMVGRELGRNRPDRATKAAWSAMVLAWLYMGSIAIWYVVMPDFFLLGYGAGMSPESFQSLRQTTTILLRFVAAYCLFDAMNVVFAAALKGAGDTRYIFLANLSLSAPPVVMIWLGVHYFNLGLWGCWVILTAWVYALGLAFLVRFLQGRWRQMRLIEPSPEELP
ncbi:MAG: MATE family efflux transporter [Thermoguttaceae bacterium]|nr:MATE family efflux transporter [Thermoguttaceae bacterium]MDW8039072.1 MATE family efflux transporter [Thermoguttaceae bacterium]